MRAAYRTPMALEVTNSLTARGNGARVAPRFHSSTVCHASGFAPLLRRHSPLRGCRPGEFATRFLTHAHRLFSSLTDLARCFSPLAALLCPVERPLVRQSGWGY